MSILVSVVMLAYNVERYLEESAHNVINQVGNFDIELIIAEDCSTDGTLAIAKRLEQNFPDKVKVISREHNFGLVKNCFRAISECRGDFIAFCDGDDWWCNLKKLDMQLKKFDDPSVGMVHGNFCNQVIKEGVWETDFKGVLSGRDEGVLRGDELFPVFLKELVPRKSSCVYRKSVLAAFAGTKLHNESYTADDLPMAVFAAANHKIEYVDEVVTVYRLSPNSATRSQAASSVRFLKGVLRIYDDFGEVYGKRVDYDHAAAAWAARALACASFRSMDRIAFEIAMSRLKQSPSSYHLDWGIMVRRALMAAPWMAGSLNRMLDWKRAEN